MFAVCLFIWLYICTKYHPNILSKFGVKEQVQKFVKKNTKNAFFTHKIGNRLKRTWHHMKEETLKKASVNFAASRLNTLRENIHF